MRHPFMTAALAIIAATLVALGAVSMEILSAARAYVAGEGLWSKAQKDAVGHLHRYGRSRDPAHFASYRAAIAVPLGDRKARLALDRAAPDYALAREGFLEGRNHADDVDAMARLFVRFRNVPHVARAIDIWTQGDENIALLDAAAAALQAEVSGGRAEGARAAAALAEIEAINERLTPLEDAFSETLGDATRWVKRILLGALLAAAVLLVAVAALLLRRVATAERALHESERRLRMVAEHDARRFQFLAHHDLLTGLPNRVMFEDRAREAVARARRRAETAALLFLDLDHFKDINDSLGHEGGDALLRAAAERLRGCVRGEDFVARIGGDEFCVLLQGLSDPREAASVAQKVGAALAQPYRIGAREVASGASIGIACTPQDGAEVADLLRLADAAMYRAKEAGRHAYRFAAANIDRELHAAAGLAEELRASLERNELFVCYQPRVDFHSRRPVAAEALLRWPHPRFGLLLPEAFLPLAEDAGLAPALAAKLLSAACVQAKRWLDEGVQGFTVAVSIPARLLRHPGLPGDVRAALAASSLPPRALRLEVPETALRHAAEPVREALAALADTGARLCVDDFGSGYASLPLLRSLRISAVSIDRRLVSSIPADSDAPGLVRGLIALARGLDMEVVVRGIDTAAHCNFVIAAGGLVGQGDFLAAAGLAGDIGPLLSARRAA
jgi:diguanylate cyclase (GGDEF)-like protein